MLKLIINFTPTGMIPTKDMTANVPISVNEIIEEVQQACELGITMAHLHARDEEGVPTYRKNIYRDIVEGVRKHCPELLVCLSLSGRNFNQFEKRSEALELCPDLGSLTLSSLNFTQQASVNSPEMIQQLAQKMKDFGVKPELEVFDLGMINYAKYLAKKSLIEPPYYFNIILGNVAGMQADLMPIGLAINELPADSVWSLGGIGASQIKTMGLGIIAGGGVRIGLEDNIFYDQKKTKLATNMDLIKRVHDLAAIYERPIMTPTELGEMGFYNKNRMQNA